MHTSSILKEPNQAGKKKKKKPRERKLATMSITEKIQKRGKT